MKAFEEWWKEKDCDDCHYDGDLNFWTCDSCGDVAEKTWKAALEWVKAGDECNGEGYGCMLVAKIDEELKD